MPLGRRQDFEMHSGDDLDLVITVQDAVEAGVDITGATSIRWQLSRLATGGPRPGPAGAALVEKALGAASGITLSGVSGCVVALSGVDTAALRTADYYHELELVVSGRTTTGLYGIAEIQSDLIE